MTTVLRHGSQYCKFSNGIIYMWIEIIHNKTYTIKFTIHAPQCSGLNCEKYIRDIPYIPTPMLEMIKLLQLYENDFNGEKIYESLSTIFNSTLRQTMQKEYETYKIDAITIQKDKIEKENTQLKHTLTCNHYELLQSTSKIEKIEKELATAQSTIQQLSQDLEDTTTELKICESRCMQYEDLYEQEKEDRSLETILENALDELSF